MNERIKGLKDLARDYYLSQEDLDCSSHRELHDMIEQKFAELIIRECAKVAWRHTPDYEDLDYGHLIKNKILNHFGVER